jgi:hypothetical protein
LKRKLKAVTKKTLPYKLEERLQKLKQVWQGWVNHYRLASIQIKFKTVDEWLRNRSDIVFGTEGSGEKARAKA